jgi:hypothetical protein
MFQADKFNIDGKIIEEWMVYDQSNLASIIELKIHIIKKPGLFYPSFFI